MRNLGKLNRPENSDKLVKELYTYEDKQLIYYKYKYTYDWKDQSHETFIREYEEYDYK